MSVVCPTRTPGDVGDRVERSGLHAADADAEVTRAHRRSLVGGEPIQTAATSMRQQRRDAIRDAGVPVVVVLLLVAGGAWFTSGRARPTDRASRRDAGTGRRTAAPVADPPQARVATT